jgi:outer membrane protein insertion porin family
MEVRRVLQRNYSKQFQESKRTEVKFRWHFFPIFTFLALYTIIFLSPAVYTQGVPQPEMYRILGISVEGNVTADASAIIANSGLRVGDEISIPGDRTAQAIRQLHALRIFNDIRIEIEQRTADGLYLVIRVEELPRLERVEFTGNNRLKDRDLRKVVDVARGQVVSPRDLNRLENAMKKEYTERGRILAEIESELIQEPEAGPNRVVLRFTITEGADIRVRGVEFVGNDEVSDRRLRRQLGVSTKRWWKFWTRGRFDPEEYQEGLTKIIQHYRKEGFRDADIVSDTLIYDNADLFVQVRVEEGPRYYVRDIDWVGNTVYEDAQLSARLGFDRGDVYNMERFERNLFFNPNQVDVASLYMDNGYLAFSAEPEEVRVPPDSIDLRIRVRENNQFRIGQVLVRGNTKTRENVIRRSLYSRPGDYYSRQNLIRSIRELQQLNYFNPEAMEPNQYLVDDETVNIVYNLEEKSSDTFNASVGYAQGWGFTGGLGLSFNNFDLRRPLRGGGGQQLTFDWQFGEAGSYRTFSISFTEPWLYDTPTLLGVNVYDTRYMWFYDMRQTGGSVRIGRRFIWPDDYFRGDWIVRAQRNDVIRGQEIFPEGVTTQISVAQIISRNSIDNPIFPTRGSNVSLMSEIAGGPFLPGTVEFHRHTFEAKWYTPMFNSNKFALALMTKTSALFPFNEDTRIPPLELFFMGGTGIGQFNVTPLRGYDDRKVGPIDARGREVGGKAMAVHTLEFRFAPTLNPIPIFLLTFLEAGNVWSDFNSADFGDLRRSAGFGVRMLVQPLGMLGFDYAYGFDDVFPRNGKPDGWQFHFQFGRGL